jgi:anti-anti-sigma factor
MTAALRPAPSRVSAPTPELTLDMTEVGRAVVLRLAGEAQVFDVARFHGPFLWLVARRVPLVVLDLTDLILLSSLAIGALLTLRRDLARFGGRTTIVGARPAVYEVLKAAHLHTLFESHATVEKALASL